MARLSASSFVLVIMRLRLASKSAYCCPDAMRVVVPHKHDPIRLAPEHQGISDAMRPLLARFDLPSFE